MPKLSESSAYYARTICSAVVENRTEHQAGGAKRLSFEVDAVLASFQELYLKMSGVVVAIIDDPAYCNIRKALVSASVPESTTD